MSVCLARVMLPCDGFNCSERFFADKCTYKNPQFKFCPSCKKAHSYKVLVLQTKFQKSIRDMILDAARTFTTTKTLADSLGTTQMTVYFWLRKYFDMTFAQFKKQHIDSPDS